MFLKKQSNTKYDNTKKNGIIVVMHNIITYVIIFQLETTSFPISSRQLRYNNIF